jgi:hypothetical protein
MIKIDVDMSGLSGLTVLDSNLQKEVELAGQKLVVATYARITEQVGLQLHSSRNTYLQALKYTQTSGNTWVISLGNEAMWIEEGIPPNTEMIDKTLKGASSKIIPFNHSKTAQDRTIAQASLVKTLAKELKRKKIPFDKIERDPSGKPKSGKLHSFDIVKKNVPKSRFTGRSYLQTVNIFQQQTKDAKGNQMTQRSIFTFRTMTQAQKGSGMWVNKKGFVAKKFLDDAAQWAQDNWDNEILPALLKRIS